MGRGVWERGYSTYVMKRIIDKENTEDDYYYE